MDMVDIMVDVAMVKMKNLLVFTVVALAILVIGVGGYMVSAPLPTR